MKEKDKKILQYLKTYGPKTRLDIANENDVAWSTVYDALKRLELEERVERYREGGRKKRGTPRIFWRALP